jgi:hypothetical protein
MSTETTPDMEVKHDGKGAEMENAELPPDMLNGDEGDGSATAALLERKSLWGLASLVTVPLVWGTYVPAVRFIYENHVPGFVFSASYHCVSTLTSLAILTMNNRERPERSSHNETTSLLQDAQADALDAGVANVGSTKDDDGDSMAVALRGGLELGIYTFLASSLQVVGLETVPSDRAGFLIQRTFALAIG